MAIYRKIEIRMWGDEKFCALSPMPACGQALWIYLLTGPHTGPIPGLCRAGRAGMAEQLEWALEDFDDAFAEITRHGMAEADFKARVVWIPKAIFCNPSTSKNAVLSWAKEWQLIPECPIKIKAYEALKSYIYQHAQSFSEAFDKACRMPSAKASVMPSLLASPLASALPSATASVMASDMPSPMPSVMASVTPSPLASPIQEQEQEQEQEGKTSVGLTPDGEPADSVSDLLVDARRTPDPDHASEPATGARAAAGERTAQVQEVFEHWRTARGHAAAKLDAKRERCIGDRLRDGYTVEQLCQAIDGVQNSPHHRGENDRHTVYDSIELICRDAAHVDQFLRFAKTGDPGVRPNGLYVSPGAHFQEAM